MLQQNRRIEILNPPQDEKADLMEDFVSLVTSFAARLLGNAATSDKRKNLDKTIYQSRWRLRTARGQAGYRLIILQQKIRRCCTSNAPIY